MTARNCQAHPERKAAATCFRCRAGVCASCAVRVAGRPFCNRGCSLIFLMQRAAEADWEVARGDRALGARWRQWRRRRALGRHCARLATLGVPGVAPRVLAWRMGFLLLLLAASAAVGLWTTISIPRVSLSPPEAVTPLPSAGVPPPEPAPPPLPAPSRSPVPDSQDLPGPSLPSPLEQLPKDYDLARGPTTKPLIALTFDGGSFANATPEILTTLKEKGVRVTMFLTGKYIRRFPELVRRMVREGHEVGNHTFSHPRLTTYAENRRQETRPGVDGSFLARELNRTAEAFEQVTGRRLAPYWRAPYGEHNAEIRRWAAEVGYLHVGWTRVPGIGDLDSRDWVADPDSRIYFSAKDIRERLLQFGRGRSEGANGGIVLMHLGTVRQGDQPYREIGAIIDGFRARGYRFVTISEMIAVTIRVARRASTLVER